MASVFSPPTPRFDRGREILSVLLQPLTPRQIARKIRHPAKATDRAVRRLRDQGYLTCLNPTARRNRLYWLTKVGCRAQRTIRESQQRAPPTHDFPSIDWDRYGELCFRHRSGILRVLKEPLQPAGMKRRARYAELSLRMSANNARDAVKRLAEWKVVEPFRVRKKPHPLYRLTEVGLVFRRLLLQAEEAQ